MKKLVVAVSGGVDSVVLLDFLDRMVVKDQLNFELIVAHFEHGIRKSSEEDLKLVQKIAKDLSLKFEFERGNLGEKASEEKAREARYNFLRRIAKKYDAKIATAHHQDDLTETVLINLKRGTSWRGLAAMDSADIWRPFLGFTKAQILDYAKRRNLIWNEDETNSSDKYLRNRLRKKMKNGDENLNSQIYDLWKKQIILKDEIDGEIIKIIPEIKTGNNYSRYFFVQISENVALEILRRIIIDETGEILTRSQLQNFWLNIKVIPAGKKMSLSGKNVVKFTKTTFSFK